MSYKTPSSVITICVCLFLGGLSNNSSGSEISPSRCGILEAQHETVVYLHLIQISSPPSAEQQRPLSQHLCRLWFVGLVWFRRISFISIRSFKRNHLLGLATLGTVY